MDSLSIIHNGKIVTENEGVIDGGTGLSAGKHANVLLLSPDLELQNVWVRGRSIGKEI